MRFHHGKDSIRKLIAINLVAWTAGAVFLFRSCGPMEEERMTPSAAAVTATKACGEHDCVFRLK